MGTVPKLSLVDGMVYASSPVSVVETGSVGESPEFAPVSFDNIGDPTKRILRKAYHKANKEGFEGKFRDAWRKRNVGLDYLEDEYQEENPFLNTDEMLKFEFENSYDNGGPISSVPPFVTSDRNEYNRRRQAYADSLFANNYYNEYFRLKNQATNSGRIRPWENQQAFEDLLKFTGKYHTFGNYYPDELRLATRTGQFAGWASVDPTAANSYGIPQKDETVYKESSGHPTMKPKRPIQYDEKSGDPLATWSDGVMIEYVANPKYSPAPVQQVVYQEKPKTYNYEISREVQLPNVTNAQILRQLLFHKNYNLNPVEGVDYTLDEKYKDINAKITEQDIAAWNKAFSIDPYTKELTEDEAKEMEKQGYTVKRMQNGGPADARSNERYMYTQSLDRRLQQPEIILGQTANVNLNYGPSYNDVQKNRYVPSFGVSFNKALTQEAMEGEDWNTPEDNWDWAGSAYFSTNRPGVNASLSTSYKRGYHDMLNADAKLGYSIPIRNGNINLGAGVGYINTDKNNPYERTMFYPTGNISFTKRFGDGGNVPEFGPGGEYLKSYEPTRYVTYLPKAEDGVKVDGFVIDEPDREIEIDNYQSPFELDNDTDDEYTPYQPVGVEYEQPDTNTFLEAPDISDSLKMVYDQDTAKVDSVKNQIMENTKVIQKNLADQGYYDRIVKDMNKNDIKSIQQKLIDSGYDLGKYGADGIFGPLTQKAWREFNIDGKAGNLTAKAQEYYMKENNIDKVVNNVYEDIKAVGNNGVEQVQESIVSNISKIPTYVENETGKSLIPKGNLFTKKETKRVLKGSDAIKNALRDIMPDISSWNGAVKDTLKDVFSWHNRNKIVDVSVGNIPLPANGANYVIGGGVALDNDDQVLETTTSQIDTKRFKFSSGDRDLTKLTPWHKDNTQCIVGLQRFMLDHNVNIDDFGVNGNFAWTILNKMVEKNNIGFYNIFAGADPSVGGSESKVKEYMSSKINTEEYQNAMSELNVGDVVTLYYKGSTFYGQAKRQTDKNNPTYTTHVGMIVEVDGQKQVWHNVHGTVLHVPLSAATGTKMPTYKGAIQVSGVVKLGGEDTQNYMDCSRFGVTEAEYFYDKDGNKTSLKSKERIFSPEAYRMYGALTPERDSLLLYNDNITDTKDFDYLVSLTCAEAYQETEYGRLAVIENDRLGIQSSLQQKLFKAGKNNLIPFRTTSDTLTNIKFDDKISDYELKLLGVYDLIRGDKHSYNEKETIMNSPEFSAQIGFQMVSRQSEVLDNLIDYAGLDPKFKAKTKENDFYTAMMALAWNQGITNKQTIGTLKKFSELYKTKGEEEAMKYLWSLIRDTKHLPHLSNVRQNVNAIDVNSDMAQSHRQIYSLPTLTISGKGTESHDTYTDYLQTDNYYYLENNGESDGVYEEGSEKYDEKKTTNAMLYNQARKESTNRTTDEAIKIYNNYKVKY